MTPYIAQTYFDMASAMMLNQRGIDRVEGIKWAARNSGMSQKALNAKIVRVFTLDKDEFKFFSAVNNCNKLK